jgi:hypothetical protein
MPRTIAAYARASREVSASTGQSIAWNLRAALS